MPNILKGAAPRSRRLPPLERQLQDAAQFIRRSFHRRPILTEIARAASLSPFYLHRRFQQEFGESPFQMVARLQIDLAKGLLLRGVPIRDVAERCGYNNQSHFTIRFRMATGTTPARWRGSGGS